MLNGKSATGYVDLVIPRGGRRLIDFVRDNARIPCIETGAGVVHCYFDASGDMAKGRAIVNNAKTRRVSLNLEQLCDLSEDADFRIEKSEEISFDQTSFQAKIHRHIIN